MGQASFIPPEVAPYPGELPAAYTAWLYGDREGNPTYWDQPAQWPMAGRIMTYDQSFTLDVPAQAGQPFAPPSEAANTIEFDLNIGFGQRCLLFSRAATVGQWQTSLVNPNTTRLPTQPYQLVWYRQAKLDGQEEVQAAPLSNVFGTAAAPNKFIVPFTWDPRIHRRAALSIPYTILEHPFVTVVLTFKVAALFSGR